VAADLRSKGFEPATVVDIGVGTGTPALYAAFPNAYHVLLEPLEEFTADIERVLQRYRGRWVMTAVGSEDGSATIHVDQERRLMSSIATRTALTRGSRPVESRMVPLAKLDTIRHDLQLTPPFGLKIDTEGHELDVIRGATEFLRDTVFVVAEVSVAPRFEGGYTFLDFITLMAEHGFRLHDVLAVYRRRRVGTLLIDGLFVPAPSE
jgi:FkbM family methyltransferase